MFQKLLAIFSVVVMTTSSVSAMGLFPFDTLSSSASMCSDRSDAQVAQINSWIMTYGAQGIVFDEQVSTDSVSPTRNIALEARLALVQKLQNSIACYGSPKFKSYAQASQAVVSFKKKLATWTSKAQKETPDAFVDVHMAVIQLQQSLLALGQQAKNLDIMQPVSFDQQVAVSAQTTADDSFLDGFTLDASANANGGFDLTNAKAKVALGLKGSVGYIDSKRDSTSDESKKIPTTISGDILVNALLLNNNIYVNVDHFLLGMSPSESDFLDFVAMKDKFLAKIGQKYVRVPLKQDTKDIVAEIVPAIRTAIAQSVTMTEIIKKQPLFVVVGKQGNVYGLVPSPVICSLVPAAATSCLKELKQLRTKVGVNGLLSLTINKDKTYALGLPASLMKMGMTSSDLQDVKHLIGRTDILTRDATGVRSFALPFKATGKSGIFYKNNALDIVYKDSSLDMRVSGPLTREKADLTMTFKEVGKYSSKMKATATLKIVRDPVTQKVTADFHLDVFQANKKQFTLTLSSSDLTTNVASVDVVAPIDVIEQADVEKIVSNLESEGPMGQKKRDTSAKIDLNQIATALQAYNMDNGSYPASTGFVSIEKILNLISKSYTSEISEHFGGVGVMTDGNDIITITKVYDNSPASKAGLQVGDIIKSIDGQVMKEANDVSKLRGDKGTSVVVTIHRNNTTFTVTLTRENITVPGGTMTTNYTGLITQSGYTYWYKPLSKNGITNAGFVLATQLQYTGANNYNGNFTGTLVDLEGKSYEQIQQMLDYNANFVTGVKWEVIVQ